LPLFTSCLEEVFSETQRLQSHNKRAEVEIPALLGSYAYYAYQLFSYGLAQRADSLSEFLIDDELLEGLIGIDGAVRRALYAEVSSHSKVGALAAFGKHGLLIEFHVELSRLAFMHGSPRETVW
jgi:hypothetical protein